MQKLTKRLNEKKNMNELDGGGGLTDEIWRGMYVNVHVFFKKDCNWQSMCGVGELGNKNGGGGGRQLKGDKMTSVNLQFSVHAMKFSLKILNEKFFSRFSVNF